MLPDKLIAEIKEQTRLYFGTEHKGIQHAAAKLLDAGFTWDTIRLILSAAFSAGYDQGRGDYDQ